MTRSEAVAARHVQICDLACQRGEDLVLSGIAFSAGPGDVVLLRGPNGAGKSTLLLCLAGHLRHEGQIIWGGRDPEARPGTDQHLIGHETAVKPSLTLAENLRFWATLCGGDETLVPQALGAAGLGGLDDIAAGHLSAGQTRRLALARLAVADRPVWLLDEPSAALDAQGERWIGAMMAAHAARGGLVIAATHLDLDLGGLMPRVIDIGGRR